MASYIPTRDVDLVQWADNFSTLTTAAPATYGLQASDAVAIAAVVTDFDNAYSIAINPGTHTPATVAAKDSAKGAMLPILRFYAQTIKLNQGVSNADKIALGIHINDAGPTPIPVPTTAPALTIDFQTHLGAQLRVRDQTTPTSNAKPFGVQGGEMVATVGVAVTTDPDVAPFKRIQTKTPVQLTFDPADVGKICTVWERWFNRKGELGPWSTSVNFVVA